MKYKFKCKLTTYERWDIIAQFLSAIIICIGIYLASDSAKDSIDEQYKTKYWEKQLEIYIDLCNTTSKIAFLQNKSDSLEFKEAVNKFYQLFYGSLLLVEDAIVESKIINYKKELDSFLSDTSSLKFRMNKLKKLSYDLSYSCRNSLSKSWKIELENISKEEK